MLRFPNRTSSSAPRAVLIGIVVAMTALGGLSWSAVTALDFLDTLDRAEGDTLQAASMIEGQAGPVLRHGFERLDGVARRLEAGGGLSAFADAAIAEGLSASGAGTLSILDTEGRTIFGPTIALDAGVADSLVSEMTAAVGRGVAALPGRAEGEEAVVLAQPVAGPGGRFQGTALFAIPAVRLTGVSKAFEGRERTAGLFRPDGLRLAGHGALGLGALPLPAPGDGLVEMERPLGGRASLLALRRVGDLPVLAAVGVPREVVLAPWRIRLDRGVAVALTSLLALFGLAWMGWASQRRETAARTALEEANTRLEQRVEERTSDLRALNQKLVRALNEKERANQAKARFLSAANHDLRQPFQALRLFHHILIERLRDTQDREIAERMGEALDSGEKLLHSLLEVATLDAGVVRPNVTDVPAAAVLEDVVSEFRAAAAAKGLALRVRPCPLLVRTDRALLTRMLRDLVRNAVAYTESGGVTVGCRRRGQWLRIEVWDTGPGIPAEQLDAIFEDFVQLGNPERDRSRGLGLGLAKVRRKAALLGHAVEVRSRLGRGSLFAVSVPVAAADRAAPAFAPASSGREPRKDGRLILVVEDDPVQRGGMQLLLESWGHHVLTAMDGEAALARLRAAERPPDVVVSDFRLPGDLNGVQIVTRAGELLGRPVPGIILTGDTAPERIREAVATGCRLLHKPFTPDLLREALAAVGTERAARQAQTAA
ncbi:ATP-binding protein [Azospirillum sp. SYSU D00513]|uniref:ATP-binding protein n=1 Tax=Azospirillum sp. SYSU D00513 TaxID=2812561 RepID=UPI001A95ADBC|nr:ATP-binding protein [Azospirillum sp. SYSU D00513]